MRSWRIDHTQLVHIDNHIKSDSCLDRTEILGKNTLIYAIKYLYINAFTCQHGVFFYLLFYLGGEFAVQWFYY